MTYTGSIQFISSRSARQSIIDKLYFSWWMVVAAFTRVFVFFVCIFWMLFSFSSSQKPFGEWIMGFIGNFESELAGIVFTVVVLDFLRWLGDRSLNKEVNEVAQEVINMLQQHYQLTPITSTIRVETANFSQQTAPLDPPLEEV